MAGKAGATSADPEAAQAPNDRHVGGDLRGGLAPQGRVDLLCTGPAPAASARWSPCGRAGRLGRGHAPAVGVGATTPPRAAPAASPQSRRVDSRAAANAMAQSAAPVRSSARTASSSSSPRPPTRGPPAASGPRAASRRCHPGGDDRHQDGGDDDASRDEHRRGLRGRHIGRVGARDDRGYGHRIAGRRGRGDSATPVPPVSRSAMNNGMPVTTTTAKPKATPSTPACHTFVRSRPPPSAKAKNGMITGMARPRNARISRSRLPISMPTARGRIPPTSVGHGNADSPATPEGHHREERTGLQRHHAVGATSRGLPYWPISAM